MSTKAGNMSLSGTKSRAAGCKRAAASLTIEPATKVPKNEIPESQPSVFTDVKKHALFLWIELINRPTAKRVKEVAKVAASLQNMVDKVVGRGEDSENEVIAGVGFGQWLWTQVGEEVLQDYTYKRRIGKHGELPSSDGDLFIHAKSNNYSKLFELAQLFMDSLPKGSVKDFDDVYGFVYKDSRDLTGFIDGTDNPKGQENRQNIAVEKETGGSYVITQKWLHNFKTIPETELVIQEAWVGRTRQESKELEKKRVNAHIARMRGGNKYQQKPKFEIVRQSLPFGTLAGGAGLFFIAYAASPENFNFMLDNMVDDKAPDEIMLFSKNVKGTFWYFPGERQLERLIKA